MLSTCWESGLKCSICNQEIQYGADVLYGDHPECRRGEAARRRAHDDGVLGEARDWLGTTGRITPAPGQLRALVALARSAGLVPVHRPDLRGGPCRWYGRVAGWSPARVQAGLSAAEAAGLWEDFLEVGRMPPVKRADISALVGVIDAAVPAQAPEVTGQQDGGA